MNVGLRLNGGSRYDTAVGHEYQRLLATSSLHIAGRSQLYVYVTSAIEAQAQRAIRPEAIALAVFGMIAGLATLIIGTQSIARQLRAGADDYGALRALGAGPVMIVADGLPGAVAAVAAGLCWPYAVAIGLSPFSLFGPVRAADPGRGIYLDWAVLGLGTLVLVAGLGGVAAVIAYRQAPHRAAARDHAGDHSPLRRPGRGGRPAAGLRRRGPAAGPGPWARAHLGAGALGPGRRGAGRGRGQRHADVRRQPDHAGVASGAVRVELQLRLLRGPGVGAGARALGRPTAGP